MSLPYILGLSVTEIIGDVALKTYANEGELLYLGVGILGYIGVVILLIINLQDSTILIVNNGWDGTKVYTLILFLARDSIIIFNILES